MHWQIILLGSSLPSHSIALHGSSYCNPCNFNSIIRISYQNSNLVVTVLSALRTSYGFGFVDWVVRNKPNNNCVFQIWDMLYRIHCSLLPQTSKNHCGEIYSFYKLVLGIHFIDFCKGIKYKCMNFDCACFTRIFLYTFRIFSCILL